MADTPINNGVETHTGKALLAKKVWYFIQPTSLPVGSKAILPAYQTEGDTTVGGDSVDEQTKQGRIVMPSTNEDSVELTQYFSPGDPTADYLVKAKHEGHQVKVWRVTVDEALAEDEGDYKVYPAMFGYGVPDEVELSDGDDLVEANYTLNILDKLKDGTFPLTDADIKALEQIYEYERPGETTGDFGGQAKTPVAPKA